MIKLFIQELARSLSVPGRDCLEDEEPEARGLISLGGSGYNSGRNLIRNGSNSYKNNEPCTLHGTIKRGVWGSSGACNNPDVTLDDDVFDDKHPSPLPGLMAAATCKNNTGPSSRAIFINPPDPNHTSRFAYLSKGIVILFIKCIINIILHI